MAKYADDMDLTKVNELGLVKVGAIEECKESCALCGTPTFYKLVGTDYCTCSEECTEVIKKWDD